MASFETTPALSTVLQLAYARTVVVRDVDASLEGHHGLGLNDLALLLELSSSPNGRLRRLDLAERLGITPSGVARQLAPLERRGLVGRESHPGGFACNPWLRGAVRPRRNRLRTISDTPGRLCAARRSSPLRRLPPRPLPRARRRRPRRRGRRGRARLGRERRRQDHAAATRRRARAAPLGRRARCSASISASTDGPSAPRWRSSATRRAATTTSPCARTSSSRREQPPSRPRVSTRPSTASVSVRSRTCSTAAVRRTAASTLARDRARTQAATPAPRRAPRRARRGGADHPRRGRPGVRGRSAHRAARVARARAHQAVATREVVLVSGRVAPADARRPPEPARA